MKVKRSKLNRVAALIASAVLSIGCDRMRCDFGNGYYLERFSENGLYYVHTSGDNPGVGVFEGTVERIGVTNDFVTAFVRKCYRGDPDGWYVLNTKSTKIVGPLSESAIQELAGLSTSNCLASEQFVSKWTGQR